MSASQPSHTAPPSNTELERALQAVPGVAEAHVEGVAGTTRSRLRIRLNHGEEADVVAWAVATTLRERFGIDLDPAEIRPRPAGDTDDQRIAAGGSQGEFEDVMGTAELYAPDRRVGGNGTSNGDSNGAAVPLLPRASIQHLDTHVDLSDVVVTATLSHGGTTVRGEASSVPTQQGILRAVAESTVRALRTLTGDQLVAGVDRVAVSVSGDPAIATVVISVVGSNGDETLLGSALVRDDAQRAVMRATLDALNRRVEHWLVSAPVELVS